jgi:hypothetical protein
MDTPKSLIVTDNDAGEITVTTNGKEVRGWSYANDTERRVKMIYAREYVEGWYDGFSDGINRGLAALDRLAKKETAE